MSIVIEDWVPADRMRLFHEIVVATGGRYRHNPSRCGERFRVAVEFSDAASYRAHSQAWDRIQTPIREAQRPLSWPRRWARCIESWIGAWRRRS